MPIEIKLDGLPAGMSMHHALPNENVLVRTSQFLSSEDGNDFVLGLEGISGCYGDVLDRIGVRPSQVDHLLAIVRPTEDATIYVNECQQSVLCRAKRTINAGAVVTNSDIADIHRMEFRDKSGRLIEVPDDCGCELLFSVGWRKGLYYDFGVFGPNAPRRTIDLPELFGQFFARLAFQNLFSMSEEQWARLLEWGWFPFIALNENDRDKLVSWASQEREPHSVLIEICESYRNGVSRRAESWLTSETLKTHSQFIESALQNYQRGDFVASIQVLFPRIEGILRSLHFKLWPTNKVSQSSLAKVVSESEREESLLLPQRFRNWLESWYFHHFDEHRQVLPLSRNSVAHGVSRANDYGLTTATVGFLVIDQLFYYLRPHEKRGNS